MPPAYSSTLGESSDPRICGVMPGIVGWLWSGRFAPPLAANQSNTDRIASGVAVSGPLAFALIDGPRYVKRNCCGLPAGDDEAAMLLEVAATDFAKLAFTDHVRSPVGCH